MNPIVILFGLGICGVLMIVAWLGLIASEDRRRAENYRHFLNVYTAPKSKVHRICYKPFSLN